MISVNIEGRFTNFGASGCLLYALLTGLLLLEVMFRRTVVKLAATLTPITYVAWSLWLGACGVALLVS